MPRRRLAADIDQPRLTSFFSCAAMYPHGWSPMMPHPAMMLGGGTQPMVLPHQQHFQAPPPAMAMASWSGYQQTGLPVAPMQWAPSIQVPPDAVQLQGPTPSPPVVTQSAMALTSAPGAPGPSGPPALPGGQEIPSFADDGARLSTCYRQLGLVWSIGEKRCCPKRFRASLITVCDPMEWPTVKLAQMSEEETDLMLFIVTGLLPTTRTVDLGAKTKGEAREAVHALFQHRMKKNASRLSALSDELDNLAQVALRMGYPPELFSKELHLAYQKFKQSREASFTGDVAHQGLQGMPAEATQEMALPGPAAVPELQDAPPAVPCASASAPAEAVAETGGGAVTLNLPPLKFSSTAKTPTQPAPKRPRLSPLLASLANAVRAESVDQDSTGTKATAPDVNRIASLEWEGKRDNAEQQKKSEDTLAAEALVIAGAMEREGGLDRVRQVNF